MTPRHRRRIPLLVAIVLALAAVSACGVFDRSDSSEDDASAGAAPTLQHALRDPDRKGPAPEVRGAAQGGRITVYLPDDPGPESLDPAAGWLGVGNAIQQALTSRSLTQYARDEDGNPVLVPDLATDLGTPSEDFTQWTFTIRDDATWEDGEPVTADQVAFGICRALDSKVFASRPVTEYAAQYFRGARGYPGPYTGKDRTCEKWRGISVDGQDVTLSMSRPFPDMDYLGAIMAMGPVPPGDVSDPSTYGERMVSNGPYRVAKFVAGEELMLVRNERWDPVSDPARHQYVDEWVFKFNQDSAVVDQMMLSGSEESLTAISTSLGAESYGQAKAELEERLVVQPSQCVNTLAPDNTVISDPRVRQALAYAYPYQDAWEASGQIADVTRVRAGSLLPPGLPGRSSESSPIAHDPEKSRELLAEAGHGDDPYPITMIYYAVDPKLQAAQDVITESLEEGGFAVKAIGVQESPYNIWLDPDNKINRKLNLRGINWCADWPSGSAMLPTLLDPGSRYNVARFDDPAISKAMDDIALLPREEQAQAWGALDEQVMSEELPIIPTAYRNEVFVFGDQIGNPTGDASIVAPNFKDLYVIP